MKELHFGARDWVAGVLLAAASIVALGPARWWR